MKKILAFGFWLLAFGVHTATAQRMLNLDSCRAMALRNNKQLSVSKVKQEVAKNLRKSARTKYLPHISAIGGYEYSSRSISLLSDDQQFALNHLGTGLVGNMKETFSKTHFANILANLPSSVIGTAEKTALMQDFHMVGKELENGLNQKGSEIVEAFNTNTHHVFGGGVLVTQPLFMGGAIVAMNRLATIGEQFASNSAEAKRQLTLYNIDQTYWQVVSLRHKQKLAESYLEVVKKLDSDVQRMIEEGFATRSEGLSVSVKVNEAEMALLRVEDGLTLSRMLLNQLCGLPVDEKVTLVDEEKEDINANPDLSTMSPKCGMAMATENRPELKMLQNVVDMSRQTTNILKAANLPQVLLTGGWMGSNPSVYNGFQRKFKGAWNVGVMVRVPIWNWGDVMYKVRASKGATTIATLEMEDAREKIELQVNQSSFRVSEANKKLQQANANIERANENLRTANLGFQEGVISSTTVMEAQTAWLQAQSQKIDAEIDVKLSEVNMQKALGTLQ
jgi:outer membrane protein TolC